MKVLDFGLAKALGLEAGSSVGPNFSSANPAESLTTPEISGRDENIMMAVQITGPGGFRAGPPRELFRGRYQASNALRIYDVARDGRFLMVERGSAQIQSNRSLRVVFNWHDELKRGVPTN